jgi:outer membrane protein OmpA-like peptidoglycan-associated protein
MAMNEHKPLRLLPLCLFLTACVSERVVLLPEPDGRPSAVQLQSGSASLVLDTPYQSARRQGGSLVDAGHLSPEEVQARYGALLGDLPPRPAHFTLYFLEGSSTLTPESVAQFDDLRRALAAHPAAEMRIVGHTDTLGSAAANDALSLERAEAMRAALQAENIVPAKIEVVGRGEREPLVPTADEVAEPRNRRVVIDIR